jgi:CBS-domain-containing membrane protein
MASIDLEADGSHGTLDCHAGDDVELPGRVDVAEASVRVRLGDVIGTDTMCVRGTVTVDQVTTLLVETRLRAVPVVDENRRLLGIVSKTDVLRAGYSAEARERTVSEIMTPVVHGLPEDAPVAYAISLMAFEGLHEVPVVDAEGRVIGMMTATDALRWVAQALGYVIPGAEHVAGGRRRTPDASPRPTRE